MDSKVVMEMVFGILGGLGIFLLGMKYMSEGMQAVAGDKMRKLIAAVTNNRLIACGVGTAVTCLVQSSSITTVTVVGMVNAGIMNLTQAIGVIFGANIGTTITGWILVIKVGKYGLPLLGISAIIYLFSKHEKIRYIASVFIGLGMVFYGLQLMKLGFAPIKEMPEFIEWFSRVSPTSYFSVLRCCLIGAALTAIVQSSSATLVITMGLAFNGIIDYPTAAALVLGENIGTTITAYLASLGASRNAKRASYAHIMFNVAGVIWITAIFHWYIQGVEAFVQWQSGVNVAAEAILDGQKTFPHVMKAIAMTHTGFNVVNVIMFLPFVKVMGKFLYWLMPDKTVPEEPKLTSLDIRMLETPAFGIQQSGQEIVRMSRVVADMMEKLKPLVCGDMKNAQQREAVFQQEREMDVIQKEITEFISHLLSGNVPHDVADDSRKQLRIADEYESISDYVTNILKLRLKMHDMGEKISSAGLENLMELHDKVADYVRLISDAVVNKNEGVLTEAEVGGKSITAMMKKFRAEHLNRVSSGAVTPLNSLIFTDMLNAYRRIKDHGLNIAEAVAGEK